MWTYFSSGKVSVFWDAIYAISTIIYHSAVTVRSLARCPGLVQLIHGAWYGLTFETCEKIHFKVAPSFPGGTSQVYCFVLYVIFLSFSGKFVTFISTPSWNTFCEYLCPKSKAHNHILYFSMTLMANCIFILSYARQHQSRKFVNFYGLCIFLSWTK